MLPMELLIVNLPVLSPMSHSCLSLHWMTAGFYGFTRTDGFLLISSLFLMLLQPELSLPCFIKYYSSICILPSRNLLKCLIYRLLLFLLPLHSPVLDFYLTLSSLSLNGRVGLELIIVYNFI